MSKVEKKETGRMIVDGSPAWRLLRRLLATKPDPGIAFVSYDPCQLILDMVASPEFFQDRSAFLCDIDGDRIGELRIRPKGLVRGFR